MRRIGSSSAFSAKASNVLDVSRKDDISSHIDMLNEALLRTQEERSVAFA
jgi:hypothetical protein